jgi:hypothetical protein
MSEDKKIEIKKGTTYNGRTFFFSLNNAPLDLTMTDIIITFAYDIYYKENTARTGIDTVVLTIGDGVNNVVPLNGEFTMLSDTIINWAKGKWNYEVKFIFPDNSVKIWYENTLWIV